MSVATRPVSLAMRAELHEINFAAGMPGFPTARGFVLSRWGADDSVFVLMTSVADPSVSFIAVDPCVFFPGYSPEVTGETLRRIGAKALSDVWVMVLLTLGETPADATANLIGPIVIHVATGEAVQAVLSGSAELTHAPIAARS